MVLTDDVPTDPVVRDKLFASAMGSPDPYGRQLNGMGGGISSLSKVCVIGPPSREDADVDYTFGQILVDQARVDYAGNCGNMSSAVGPFALIRGLVKPAADGEFSLVIHNTNTGKLIRSTFTVEGGAPCFSGSFQIDGVSGTGAPIRLDFLDPEGSKTDSLLPTGQARETLHAAGTEVKATLIDAASPCVFVDAADLGLSEPPSPDELDHEVDLLARLERLRCEASIRMGLAKDPEAAARLGSQPRIAMVFSPQRHAVASGRTLEADAMDVAVRMISMGKPHRALPITGAICLASPAGRGVGALPSCLSSRRRADYRASLRADNSRRGDVAGQ
jgi:2-methylaconitate cis-trans-isomerase PrpF